MTSDAAGRAGRSAPLPVIALAVPVAAAAPPTVMILLWEALAWSARPQESLTEALTRITAFVAAEYPFFLVVAALGACADAWLRPARRRLLIDVVLFAAAGAVTYAPSMILRLIGTAPSLASVLTVSRLAVTWWAPFAAIAGVVYWAITAAALRRRG